jgi:hypothetical protein
MMSLSPLVFTDKTHRFFKQLATAQAATAAYLIGHMYQAGGTPPKFSESSPISQVCFTQPVEIEFNPEETLGAFSKGIWPPVINLKSHAGSPRPVGNSNLSAIQLLMGSLYEHAFISYFENIRAQIEAKHGTASNWPDVLTFGRLVRNAFAHGGTLDIRNDASANWGGISYSRSENGRRVLYNDLSSGDLTLLMVEMDGLF